MLSGTVRTESDLRSNSHSSSLDPLETSSRDHPCNRGNLSTHFRHSGWDRERRRVYDALKDSGAPQHRLDRFRDCGSSVWVWQAINDPTLYRLRGNYCRDRWCIPCANAKAQTIMHNLWDRVRKIDLKMLTLTVRSEHEPLRPLIVKLMDGFKTLRSTRFWKTHVFGGAAMLEVKYNRELKRWHPHLHVLLDARYMDHDHLRSLWRKITVDSYIVHITRIPNAAHACNYVCKYVGKGLSSHVIQDKDRLVEAMDALRNTRTVNTFGNWRGWRLTLPPKRDDWAPVMSFETFIQGCSRHNDICVMISVKLFKDPDALFELALEEDDTRSPPGARPLDQRSRAS